MPARLAGSPTGLLALGRGGRGVEPPVFVLSRGKGDGAIGAQLDAI